MKSLSDQIREEKIARGGTDSDAAKILSFVRLLPETVYATDVLYVNLGLNSLNETITSSDTVTGSLSGLTYTIGSARIGYSVLS